MSETSDRERLTDIMDAMLQRIGDEYVRDGWTEDVWLSICRDVYREARERIKGGTRLYDQDAIRLVRS